MADKRLITNNLEKIRIRLARIFITEKRTFKKQLTSMPTKTELERLAHTKGRRGDKARRN